MFIKERIYNLDRLIGEMAENGVFPGAAYALVTRDEVYINCTGKRQVTPEEKPALKDTVFDLASLTKVVATTTCILRLIEDGKLALNTTVSSVLPEYKYEGITIKDLITHTAGYEPEPDYTFDMNSSQLRELVLSEEPDYKKRRKEVVYSDTGFMLLGFIIDKITGSFESYAKENIFSKLSMKDTCFNPDEPLKDRIASTEMCRFRKRVLCGEVHDEKAYIIGGVSGHAGLFSTAGDLSHFVQMILNGGMYDGTLVLGKSTLDLIFTSQTQGLNSNRSIGWAMKDEDTSMGDLTGKAAAYHTGYTGGSILIDRDYNKGFILLTNRVHPSRENEKLIYCRKYINNAAMSAIY